MTTARRCRFVSLILLCLVLALPAFGREWRIANFSTHMTVAKDGSADVTERLDVVFEGEYHGIYRDIPIEYPGPHGANYTLFLHVTGVTDDARQQAEVRLQRAERQPPSEDLRSRRGGCYPHRADSLHGAESRSAGSTTTTSSTGT